MKSSFGPLSSWRNAHVSGSRFKLESGDAVTRRTSTKLPGYWFSGDTTVVVGRSTRAPGYEASGESKVSWSIPLERQVSAQLIRGFLLIGCLRRFGGLHSRVFDQRADVFLNGKQLDGFALRIRAAGHSDYFHRPPLPDSLPQLAPFSECQTVYAWPIRSNFLKNNLSHQKVTVRIDREARWDIDHVGLLMQTSKVEPHVFLSHSHADKRFVRSLAKQLTSKGIKVWIDEAEMHPGDSLIQKLRKAIDSVDLLIAVLSRASINSPWVQKEIEIATYQEIKHKKLKVIPVLRGKCALPGFLEGKLYADFTTPYRQRRNFPSLIKAIRDHK